jgi:hypothetical protein
VISGRTDEVTRTVTVGIDPTGHVTNTVFTASNGSGTVTALTG